MQLMLLMLCKRWEKGERLEKEEEDILKLFTTLCKWLEMEEDILRQYKWCKWWEKEERWKMEVVTTTTDDNGTA